MYHIVTGTEIGQNSNFGNSQQHSDPGEKLKIVNVPEYQICTQRRILTFLNRGKKERAGLDVNPHFLLAQLYPQSNSTR